MLAELTPASQERLPAEPKPDRRPERPPDRPPPTWTPPPAGCWRRWRAEQGLEAIGRRAQLAASEVRGALARLEGAGLVRRDPLGRYLRRAGGA